MYFWPGRPLWRIRRADGHTKGGTIMHPMFVKLYLETDTNEDERDQRRRAARVRRRQARAVVRSTASDRDRRPRR